MVSFFVSKSHMNKKTDFGKLFVIINIALCSKHLVWMGLDFTGQITILKCLTCSPSCGVSSGVRQTETNRLDIAIMNIAVSQLPPPV